MNILWDFDGTLFDTYPAFTDCLYEILNKKVLKSDIYQELKVSFTHASTYYQLSEEQMKEFKDSELALSPEVKQPFPFIGNVLKQAKINVIMTHKPRSEVQTILDFYNWNHYFQEIVAGDDGFPRKPDAASYRYLHEKYNLDLAVGDRVLDILPAKEIGLLTCLFQNNAQGADFYLDTYEEFFENVKI